MKKVKKKKSLLIKIIIVIILVIIVCGVWAWSKIQESVNQVWKPILYLYPERDMNVKINFEDSTGLIVSYPEYKNGWNILVKQDGTVLFDEQEYYALYWEEKNKNNVDFSTGFYVEGDAAARFLEEKLDIIGLNYKEKNEFIMYWLPILVRNKKNLIYFELTEEKQKYNKLKIEPEPDSLLRLTMHVKKVDKKIKIKEEKLSHFKRKGFVAVEWGGVTY